jgi:hypothetical protein
MKSVGLIGLILEACGMTKPEITDTGDVFRLTSTPNGTSPAFIIEEHLGDGAVNRKTFYHVTEPDPNIVVTDEMILAGHRAYDKHELSHTCGGTNFFVDVYRAMYALRPECPKNGKHEWEDGYWFGRDEPEHVGRRCLHCGQTEALK